MLADGRRASFDCFERRRRADHRSPEDGTARETGRRNYLMMICTKAAKGEPGSGMWADAPRRPPSKV